RNTEPATRGATSACLPNRFMDGHPFGDHYAPRRKLDCGGRTANRSPGRAVRTSTVRRLRAHVLAVVCVCGCAVQVSAHEIGKTQVTAVIAEHGSYRIDIVVDPDVLLTKLEVLGGNVRSAAAVRSRLERGRRIDALRDVLLERVG